MTTIDEQVAELMRLMDEYGEESYLDAEYGFAFHGTPDTLRLRAAVEAFARAALERRSIERMPLVWPALEKETP